MVDDLCFLLSHSPPRVVHVLTCGCFVADDEQDVRGTRLPVYGDPLQQKCFRYELTCPCHSYILSLARACPFGKHLPKCFKMSIMKH